MLISVAGRYIKELADRLNTLENSMQAGEIQYAPMITDDGTSRLSDDFSPPPSNNSMNRFSRKRTHSVSMSNDAHNQANYYGQHRPSIGASSWEPPRHLPHPTSGLGAPQTPQSSSGMDGTTAAYRSQFSPNGAGPFWRHNTTESARRASLSTPFDESRTGDAHSDTILNWDERTVDE
jgi:hypothetical protein